MRRNHFILFKFSKYLLYRNFYIFSKKPVSFYILARNHYYNISDRTHGLFVQIRNTTLVFIYIIKTKAYTDIKNQETLKQKGNVYSKKPYNLLYKRNNNCRVCSGQETKRIEYILEGNLLEKSVKWPFCCTVSILQVYFTYWCFI